MPEHPIRHKIGARRALRAFSLRRRSVSRLGRRLVTRVPWRTAFRIGGGFLLAAAIQAFVFFVTPHVNNFYDGWPRGWLLHAVALLATVLGGLGSGLGAESAAVALIWTRGTYFTPMHPGLEVFAAIGLLQVFVIHQLQRTHRALLERQEALHEANNAKDRFLASLSHELRTPLNVVLGYARMLQTKQLENPADRQRVLEIIERNGVAQLRIIEDLLDAQRITAGKFALHTSPVDLKKLGESVIDALHPAATAKSIHYAINFEPIHTVADGARLQQVLWNLVSNAIKFTPFNGCVGVSGRTHEDKIIIQVADSGEGIPPEFLPHVFERFRQLDDTTTRRHSGLGLGLAISKEIVELHGGEIRAESGGPDRGATFTIVLPWIPEAQ